eukprot:gb/GECG01014689.1/.p1 GENE.gb/GECG01014689.1/~~gb/GECG01014689.1/.p1  ORF type:complete len:670 (+),score=57.98 gb/GECG01014689.1/:1-2010(+)
MVVETRSGRQLGSTGRPSPGARNSRSSTRPNRGRAGAVAAARGRRSSKRQRTAVTREAGAATKAVRRISPKHYPQWNLFRTYMMWNQKHQYDVVKSIRYWIKVCLWLFPEGALELMEQLPWPRAWFEFVRLDDEPQHVGFVPRPVDTSNFEGTVEIVNNVCFGDLHYNNLMKLQKLRTLRLKRCSLDGEAFNYLTSVSALELEGPIVELLDDKFLRHTSQLTKLELRCCSRQQQQLVTASTQPLRNLKDLWVELPYPAEYFTDSVLGSMSKLTSLKVRGVDKSSLTPQGFRRLRNLLHLDVSGRCPTDLRQALTPVVTDDCFRHLSKLTSLDISYYTPDGITANAFRHLPNLETLWLTGYDGVDVAEAFKHLSRLRKLDLSHTGCPVSATAFFNLPSHSLTWLDVQARPYLNVEQLSSLTSLSSLHVGDLTLPSTDSWMSQLQNLTALYIPYARSSALQNIDTALDKLVYLDAMYCDRVLTNEFFSFVSNLTGLDMSVSHVDGTRITDEAFQHLRNLKHLGLNVKPVCAVTSRLFKYLSGLTSLDLHVRSHPLITDTAFIHLQNLRRMDLFATTNVPISSHTFDHLSSLLSLTVPERHMAEYASIPQLQELNVYDEPVSDESSSSDESESESGMVYNDEAPYINPDIDETSSSGEMDSTSEEDSTSDED